MAFTEAICFFILGFVRGYGVLTNFVIAIGVLVANVPEGVVAAVTIQLALTAKQMARKKVLVKNLESIETLGSTTCICSDKTGTLTQNIMTVANCWFNLEIFDCSVNMQNIELGINKKEDLGYDPSNPEFKELAKCLCLGTTAKINDQKPEEDEIKKKIGKMLKKASKSVTKQEIELHTNEAINLLVAEEAKKPLQKKKTIGDASESGLIKFVSGVTNMELMRQTIPIHPFNFLDDQGTQQTGKCEIPFNSTNKFNLIIRDCDDPKETNPDRKNTILLMKGAPERIYGRCSHILINGEEVKINKTHDAAFEAANKYFGG
jgi:sodium/potassium-transporting ATPase subunit alpha